MPPPKGFHSGSAFHGGRLWQHAQVGHGGGSTTVSVPVPDPCPAYRFPQPSALYCPTAAGVPCTAEAAHRRLPVEPEGPPERPVAAAGLSGHERASCLPLTTRPVCSAPRHLPYDDPQVAPYYFSPSSSPYPSLWDGMGQKGPLRQGWDAHPHCPCQNRG